VQAGQVAEPVRAAPGVQRVREVLVSLVAVADDGAGVAGQDAAGVAGFPLNGPSRPERSAGHAQDPSPRAGRDARRCRTAARRGPARRPAHGARRRSRRSPRPWHRASSRPRQRRSGPPRPAPSTGPASGCGPAGPPTGTSPRSTAAAARPRPATAAASRSARTARQRRVVRGGLRRHGRLRQQYRRQYRGLPAPPAGVHHPRN
jgi:hypothetical protein